MAERLDPAAAALGAVAGATVAALCAAYGAVLAIGLATLPSPEHPIQQPWFAWMELLILGIAPAMVLLAAALHAAAPPARQPLVLAGALFFAMCATLTCALHFSILVLGRHPAFAAEPWQTLVFAFRWPSVAYALDILAWDVLFPIGALLLACGLPGSGLAGRARSLLVASALLAFVGLVGVPLANMQLRNVGIVGYAVLFPIAAAILALVFHRAR
jgi:hypothetical protein